VTERYPPESGVPQQGTRDLLEAMVSIEERLDLTRFRIAGVDIWPFVRDHFLWAQVQGLRGAIRGRQHGYVTRVWQKVQALPYMLRGVRTGAGTAAAFGDQQNRDRVLILTDTMNRRLQVSGRWYDVFADPLWDAATRVGLMPVVYETSQQFVRRQPAFRPSVPLWRRMLWAYCRAILSVPWIRVPPDCAREHQRLCDLTHTRFPPSALVSLRVLRLEAAFVARLAAYWRRVLVALDPAAVVVVPATSYAGRGLCLAARDMGIPAVEMQHGAGLDHYPDCARQPHLPIGGYNTMPTHLLTWTAADRTVVESWARPRRGPIVSVVGMPLLERFRSGSTLADATDALFQRVYGERGRRGVILITLSKSVPDLVISLIEQAPDEVLFLVRLHPAATGPERRASALQLQRVRRSNWDIEQASVLPLYTLLRWTRLHLTSWSSAAVEAMRFGVPTVVMTPLGADFFRPQLEAGEFLYRDTVPGLRDEVVAAVVRSVVLPREVQPHHEAEELDQVLQRIAQQRRGVQQNDIREVHG
jgi:hypothetical protein